MGNVTVVVGMMMIHHRNRTPSARSNDSRVPGGRLWVTRWSGRAVAHQYQGRSELRLRHIHTPLNQIKL